MEALSPPTPLADLALARRLERAEALANAETVDARAVAFPDSGAEWIQVAGAHVLFDGVDSPCTQTFGLGLFDPVTSTDLDRIENFFRERGSPVFHEVCPLADAAFIQLLNERGYEPFEFSNVLYRANDSRGLVPSESSAEQTVPDSLTARPIHAGEEDLWARTAAEGWRDTAPGLDDVILSLARLIPYRPSGPCFVVEKDGQAIAAGAMGLFNGVALLAGACTIPQSRKQGAQRALLDHRLRYGAERGFDLAMIVALPGSASQRNAQRTGFQIAYTRTKWRRTAPV